MIERDYIMRMIQMLVQVLARILFHKKGAQYPEALDEIQRGSKQIVGVELDVLRRLSDTQMIDMLLLDVSLGIPKCYAVGMLLKEEAEILDLQSKKSESADAYVKSLSLLTEASLRHGRTFDARHGEAILQLAAKLGGLQVPVHARKKLFHHFERVGEFKRARDVLRAVIEEEPGFSGEGIRFYQRLKERSDQELSAGNLSREEIDKELLELQ